MIKYFILNDALNVNAEIKNRFIMIESYPYYEIYYDKQTKVEYIMRKTGHGGSSYTVLVDEEGKPLLYNNN